MAKNARNSFSTYFYLQFQRLASLLLRPDIWRAIAILTKFTPFVTDICRNIFKYPWNLLLLKRSSVAVVLIVIGWKTKFRYWFKNNTFLHKSKQKNHMDFVTKTYPNWNFWNMASLATFFKFPSFFIFAILSNEWQKLLTEYSQEKLSH